MTDHDVERLIQKASAAQAGLLGFAQQDGPCVRAHGPAGL